MVPEAVHTVAAHLAAQTDDQLADWLLTLEESYASHRSIAVGHTISLVRSEQERRGIVTPSEWTQSPALEYSMTTDNARVAFASKSDEDAIAWANDHYAGSLQSFYVTRHNPDGSTAIVFDSEQVAVTPIDDEPGLNRNAYRVDFTGRAPASLEHQRVIVLATSPRVARLIAADLIPSMRVDRVTLAS